MTTPDHLVDFELFTGAGGASCGLRDAGIDPIGFEWDPDACATHHAAGHRTVRADLSTYPFRHLRGRVRLMHGSPPCQPFSSAGLGGGHTDTRDGMPWMLRAIAEAQPLVATIENVPGLTNRSHRAYFGTVLGALRRHGYDAHWRVLNSADYGVPQVRDRLVIIARRDGQPVIWPTPTHTDGGGLFTLPWVTMRDAIGRRCRQLDRRASEASGVRLVPDAEPAPTVTTVKGQWLWRLADGRTSMVTLAELAALQAFPADYPFHGNQTSIARQIGNAMPPPLMAAIAAANLVELEAAT